MKAHYLLFFTILLFLVYSCRPNGFPIFVPKDKYKYEVDIIKNDSFYVFVKPTAETVISDTNYIIPVEIGICNYIDDTLSIKIKGIKACLNTNKNEIYEGVVETNIDTMITNLQSWRKIPFIIEFKTFNRNCIKHFSDMHSLEIIMPIIIINESVFLKKEAYFLCR